MTIERYFIDTAEAARAICLAWLDSQAITGLDVGLPEVDDRYHLWRVPVLLNSVRTGEIVIKAYSGAVVPQRSTRPEMLRQRLRGYTMPPPQTIAPGGVLPALPANLVLCDDCHQVLPRLPEASVGLVFTSPPYYNAKPEYAEYTDYTDYLDSIRLTLSMCHRVLAEGRFCVFNVAPILVRRTHRNRASQRLAVPFDFHRLFLDEGFDFVDDIIWEKPEGAGWATGRGRRFAADRQPLQYKPVPVTEYVLVYRRRTTQLIDKTLRSLERDRLEVSRIGDDYERTNVWRITPAHDSRHPAVFPLALAERVVAYYSFVGDVVLDPYAGLGTAGRAALSAGRYFVGVERDPAYFRIMADELRLSSEPSVTRAGDALSLFDFIGRTTP